MDLDVDIVQLVEQSVRLHGSRGELRGKCPFHNGKTNESLVVWEDEGKWHCWAGCGGGDAIDWVRQRDGVGFREALAILGVNAPPRERGERPLVAPDPTTPPPAEWQGAAGEFVAQTQAALWHTPNGERALTWLRLRGFTDATIRRAGLGYNAQDTYDLRAAWGLPANPWTDKKTGKQHKGERIALPRGIVIPWCVDSALWKVIVRTPGHANYAGEPWPKYHQLPGCSNAIYGGDAFAPHKPAMLCEAALDALAVQQAAGDVIAAGATGTTGGRSVTWLARLALCEPVLLAFDHDAGGEQPLDYWRSVLPQALVWRPLYDDPGAMLEAGSDVRAWAMDGLIAAGVQTVRKAAATPSVTPIASPVPAVETATKPREQYDPIGVVARLKAGRSADQ